MPQSPYDSWDDITPKSPYDNWTDVTSQNSGFGSGYALPTQRDVMIGAAKMPIQIGEGLMGFMDILQTPQRALLDYVGLPSKSFTGMMEDVTGYEPKRIKDWLSSFETPALQSAKQDLGASGRTGIGGSLSAMYRNPGLIPMMAEESLPFMAGSAGVARTLKPALGTARAAMLGEGITSAGSMAAQIHEDTGDFTKEDLLPTLGSAALTSLISRFGNKAAQKFGVPDIDALLTDPTIQGTRRIPALIGSGVTEGFVEEMPQSVQEQLSTNWATDRPLGEGVASAATTGAVTGGLMGSAIPAFRPNMPLGTTPPPNDAPPASPSPPPNVPPGWLPLENLQESPYVPPEPLPTNQPDLPFDDPYQPSFDFGSYRGAGGRFTRTGPAWRPPQRPALSEPMQQSLDLSTFQSPTVRPSNIGPTTPPPAPITAPAPTSATPEGTDVVTMPSNEVNEDVVAFMNENRYKMVVQTPDGKTIFRRLFEDEEGSFDLDAMISGFRQLMGREPTVAEVQDAQFKAEQVLSHTPQTSTRVPPGEETGRVAPFEKGWEALPPNQQPPPVDPNSLRDFAANPPWRPQGENIPIRRPGYDGNVEWPPNSGNVVAPVQQPVDVYNQPGLEGIGPIQGVLPTIEEDNTAPLGPDPNQPPLPFSSNYDPNPPKKFGPGAMVPPDDGSHLRHPTAQRWYAYMRELDKENAPDVKYREIASTMSRKTLKKGQTWRNEIVKAIEYFESTVPKEEPPTKTMEEAADEAAMPPKVPIPPAAKIASNLTDISELDYLDDLPLTDNIKTTIRRAMDEINNTKTIQETLALQDGFDELTEEAADAGDRQNAEIYASLAHYAAQRVVKMSDEAIPKLGLDSGVESILDNDQKVIIRGSMDRVDAATTPEEAKSNFNDLVDMRDNVVDNPVVRHIGDMLANYGLNKYNELVDVLDAVDTNFTPRVSIAKPGEQQDLPEFGLQEKKSVDITKAMEEWEDKQDIPGYYKLGDRKKIIDPETGMTEEDLVDQRAIIRNKVLDAQQGIKKGDFTPEFLKNFPNLRGQFDRIVGWNSGAVTVELKNGRAVIADRKDVTSPIPPGRSRNHYSVMNPDRFDRDGKFIGDAGRPVDEGPQPTQTPLPLSSNLSRNPQKKQGPGAMVPDELGRTPIDLSNWKSVQDKRKEIHETFRRNFEPAPSYKTTDFILPEGTRLKHNAYTHNSASERLGIRLKDALQAGIVRLSLDSAEIQGPITTRQARELVNARIQLNLPVLYIDVVAPDGDVVYKKANERMTPDALATWVNSHFPNAGVRRGEQMVLPGFKPEDIRKADLADPDVEVVTKADYTQGKLPFGRKGLKTTIQRLIKDEEGSLNLPSWKQVKGATGWGQGNIPKPPKVRNAQGKLVNQQAAVNYIKEALMLPSAATTTLDLSAAGRQGLAQIHTPQFWKAFYTQFKGITEKGFDQIDAEIRSKPIFQRPINPVTGKASPSLAEMAGLDLYVPASKPGPRAQATASRWIETGGSIPFLSKGYRNTLGVPVRASNRMFITFMNSLRANRFEYLVNRAHDMAKAAQTTGKMKPGFFTKNVTPLEALNLDPYVNIQYAKEIADLVNTATGQGPLKTHLLPFKQAEINLESAATVLNHTMFSPGLFASRFRMLNPFTYAMATPMVRKEYMKGTLAMASAWFVMAHMLKMAAGDEADINYKITSADFGKVRIGDARLDVGGGFQQFLVWFARMAWGGTTTAETNEFNRFGEGYRPETKWSVTERFGANKLNPAVRFAYDLASASEYVPFHMKDRAAQLAVPLYLQDLWEISQEDPDLVPGLMFTLGPLFGAGTQIYGQGEVNPRFVDPENDWIFTGGESIVPESFDIGPQFEEY